jgi:glycosyltransferase involved in cell wall biosynthesis
LAPASAARLEPGLVSIVTATYDRAATLPRAIGSVLAQDYAAWELIVVDDGSHDDTQAVLRSYDDPRIRVVRHERNLGVAAAKNTGLDLVRGEWFTVLDSDDEIVPDALSAMLGVTAAHPDVDAVTCDCIDTATGRIAGEGLYAEGYVGLSATARSTGEHWGITKTALLGDLRLDERIPGRESALWLKVGARATRYYLPRALRLYHTEGADRLSREGMDLSQMIRIFLPLSEDGEYLRLLAAADADRFHRELYLMTLANAAEGRRSRARRLALRYRGPLARRAYLVSACLLGRRWIELASKANRHVGRMRRGVLRLRDRAQV